MSKNRLMIPNHPERRMLTAALATACLLHYLKGDARKSGLDNETNHLNTHHEINDPDKMDLLKINENTENREFS